MAKISKLLDVINKNRVKLPKGAVFTLKELQDEYDKIALRREALEKTREELRLEMEQVAHNIASAQWQVIANRKKQSMLYRFTRKVKLLFRDVYTVIKFGKRIRYTIKLFKDIKEYDGNSVLKDAVEIKGLREKAK
jgi:vacuolar-type H+-ATPase subunit I/STV1